MVDGIDVNPMSYIFPNELLWSYFIPLVIGTVWASSKCYRINVYYTLIIVNIIGLLTIFKTIYPMSGDPMTTIVVPSNTTEQKLIWLKSTKLFNTIAISSIMFIASIMFNCILGMSPIKMKSHRKALGDYLNAIKTRKFWTGIPNWLFNSETIKVMFVHECILSINLMGPVVFQIMQLWFYIPTHYAFWNLLLWLVFSIASPVINIILFVDITKWTGIITRKLELTHEFDNENISINDEVMDDTVNEYKGNVSSMRKYHYLSNLLYVLYPLFINFCFAMCSFIVANPAKLVVGWTSLNYSAYIASGFILGVTTLAALLVNYLYWNKGKWFLAY